MLNETLEYLENEEVKRLFCFLGRVHIWSFLGTVPEYSTCLALINVNTPLPEFSFSTVA